jgi:glycerol-3-phosphate acyltransferase PlsY
MVQLWPAPFSTENWSLGLFSLAIPLLIIFRHRSNLGRLLRGEEPRFRAAANDSKPTPSASADQQHNDG